MLTTTATTTATPATTRSRSSSSDPAREIKITNTAALEAALEQVQRRARVRTIDVEDVVKTAAQVEANLARLLPKKYWPGLQFQVDLHARVFAKSYRGIPESTQFTLVRTRSGWNVRELARRRCNGPTRRIFAIGLDRCREQLLAHAQRSFSR